MNSKNQTKKTMGIVNTWNSFIQSLSEAAARIFSPNDDKYPDVGVQPFEGEPYQQSKAEW